MPCKCIIVHVLFFSLLAVKLIDEEIAKFCSNAFE